MLPYFLILLGNSTVFDNFCFGFLDSFFFFFFSYRCSSSSFHNYLFLISDRFPLKLRKIRLVDGANLRQFLELKAGESTRRQVIIATYFLSTTMYNKLLLCFTIISILSALYLVLWWFFPAIPDFTHNNTPIVR